MRQRQPVSDTVTGFVTLLDDRALLSAGELSAGEVIARGELTIRYGITYMANPHLSIVPDLVVADYGELLSGEMAWDFLMNRGHLYPRADVCGYRNDGEDEMIVLKQLDFDYPYDVFAYLRAGDHRPLVKLSALIATDCAAYPQRLQAHLPCYDSVNTWRDHD